MDTITINPTSEEQQKQVLALLQELGIVPHISPRKQALKTQLLNDLKEAFAEVDAEKRGETKGQSLSDLIAELRVENGEEMTA